MFPPRTQQTKERKLREAAEKRSKATESRGKANMAKQQVWALFSFDKIFWILSGCCQTEARRGSWRSGKQDCQQDWQPPETETGDSGQHRGSSQTCWWLYSGNEWVKALKDDLKEIIEFLCTRGLWTEDGNTQNWHYETDWWDLFIIKLTSALLSQALV